MVFSNLFFIYLFLPLNLILYFVVKNRTWQNIVLLGFSLFFYAWGEPVWVFMLMLTAFLDYTWARCIEYFRQSGQTRRVKIALAASLIFDLGMLGVFKYSGFLIENINLLTGLNLPVPQIALPIGISFYTFQTISYVLDVYRGQVPAQKTYYKYLMYLSSYHQLVAGPIVRYSDVAAEIENRTVSVQDFSEGITKFCVGLTKKVVVANTAGQLVAQYMDGQLTGLSVAGAWFGALLYAIQLYYDFSAYSDMAIGLGRMFGFHYHINFNYPYIAKSVTEFWRRWHISLSSFFRDYVYIPLGGNRKHQIFNICIVWFLTGLWHGASWNFILWGVFYGALLIVAQGAGKNPVLLLPPLPVVHHPHRLDHLLYHRSGTAGRLFKRDVWPVRQPAHRHPAFHHLFEPHLLAGGGDPVLHACHPVGEGPPAAAAGRGSAGTGLCRHRADESHTAVCLHLNAGGRQLQPVFVLSNASPGWKKGCAACCPTRRADSWPGAQCWPWCCPSPPSRRWSAASLPKSRSSPWKAGFPGSLPSSTTPTMPTPFRNGRSW